MNVRKTLFLINMALVLLLAAVIIKVAWPPPKARSSALVAGNKNASDPPAPNPPPLQLNIKDYQNIVNHNLFAPPDPVSSSDDPDSAKPNKTLAPPPLPNLKLELQGTVAGPPQFARANIKNRADNTIDVYRIGSIIAGARLETIEKDSVTLLYHGQKTILKVNASSAGSDILSPPDTPPTLPSTSQNNLAKLSMPLKNQIMEDIFQNARIEPFLADNQPRGLKINDLEKVEMAKFLPLKNGDVIQQVNGQLLTNRQKAFQVMKKARTQPFLEVKILRDGAEKTFSFPAGNIEK